MRFPDFLDALDQPKSTGPSKETEESQRHQTTKHLQADSCCTWMLAQNKAQIQLDHFPVSTTPNWFDWEHRNSRFIYF